MQQARYTFIFVMATVSFERVLKKITPLTLLPRIRDKSTLIMHISSWKFSTKLYIKNLLVYMHITIFSSQDSKHRHLAHHKVFLLEIPCL